PTVSAFAEAFDKAIQDKQGQPTGFFTFDVIPIRPRADGELPSMYVSNRQTITPTSADVPKPKNDAMSPLTPQEIKEVRKAVEKRLAKRKEVMMHVFSYVCVNACLWGIWLFTGAHFPWPIFVSLFWGFGVVMHLIESWYDMGLGDRMRDRELQRELARRGVDTQADLSDLFYAEKAKRDPKARLSASVENIATIVEREIAKKADAVRAENADEDDDEELDRHELKRRRRERRKYGEW
ncbi:MAG TPA: 2TM domain-containing protein, partial [Aggregatilineales bacterium]|nr:2TM domain-containing protein [Aggregatilineales bacterium]